jgi:leucyl aminopeptidase
MSPVTSSADAALSAAPSLDQLDTLLVSAAASVPAGCPVIGVLTGSSGRVDARLGVARGPLGAVGFTGDVGSTYSSADGDGSVQVAVGVGDAATADPAAVRDAAAAFGRASGKHDELAVVVPRLAGISVEEAAQVVVEGVLLSRYRYDRLRREPAGAPVRSLTVVTARSDVAAARAGAERGRLMAAATMLARDLANSPHSHLNATKLAELAEALGVSRGLTVEVFGKDELLEMGCGGLLGVNAGSFEPPRMIKLSYRPKGKATGHLTLVGKGIMYDSGGISLKPGDEVHAQMKNDMSGAAATLAAMCVLSAAGCRTAVTGYLMCTDNMPSGTAMALGDVITIRGGTTVEVVNTDAEGRLVMADALVLATEEPTDAIVDIATLTGACMRALGTGLAGVMGTNEDLVRQVQAAADAVDEPVWPLPLVAKYRKDILSPVADLRNLGTNPNGGAIHAGLFLAEFVGDRPFAHIDIAGVAQTPADTSWHTVGCSGFGARLLAQLAIDFSVPTR